MIKRTVEISQQSVHLSVSNRQLELRQRGGERAVLATIPCEDLGMLVVDEWATTYTHGALAELLAHDAAVVICGRNHLPVGALMPLSNHTQLVERVNVQLAAGRPLRKRLWQQIVRAKIRAQAGNLLDGSAARSKLLALARRVRSGDPSNVESQAARVYWSVLFTQAEFRRDPDAGGLNGLLNYGYAVMRAAVARAIVGAGLLPVIGLHHEHRSNAFCLADDLVEPLRPIVDARVRDLAVAGLAEVDPRTKRALLECLTAEVRCNDACGPLMVALHRYVASLVRCYQGLAGTLDIPIAVDVDATSANQAGDTGPAPPQPSFENDADEYPSRR